MEVPLPPVKMILNRLQPLCLEGIILSSGLVDDKWLQPCILTNTSNRAYKSRESCAPHTLPGQGMSSRQWMCLESTLMNEFNGENTSSHWLTERLEFMFQGPGEVNCGKEEFHRSCVYVCLMICPYKTSKRLLWYIS